MWLPRISQAAQPRHDTDMEKKASESVNNQCVVFCERLGWELMLEAWAGANKTQGTAHAQMLDLTTMHTQTDITQALTIPQCSMFFSAALETVQNIRGMRFCLDSPKPK